ERAGALKVLALEEDRAAGPGLQHPAVFQRRGAHDAVELLPRGIDVVDADQIHAVIVPPCCRVVPDPPPAGPAGPAGLPCWHDHGAAWPAGAAATRAGDG